MVKRRGPHPLYIEADGQCPAPEVEAVIARTWGRRGALGANRFDLRLTVRQRGRFSSAACSKRGWKTNRGRLTAVPKAVPGNLFQKRAERKIREADQSAVLGNRVRWEYSEP
jgi:hypothetical protein